VSTCWHAFLSVTLLLNITPVAIAGDILNPPQMQHWWPSVAMIRFASLEPITMLVSIPILCRAVMVAFPVHFCFCTHSPWPRWKLVTCRLISWPPSWYGWVTLSIFILLFFIRVTGNNGVLVLVPVIAVAVNLLLKVGCSTRWISVWTPYPRLNTSSNIALLKLM